MTGLARRAMRQEQGQFFGRTLEQRQISGMTVSTVAYSPGLTIPRHDHELASFCLVLDGGFDEQYGHRRRTCRTGCVVLHPEGEHHADEHHDEPTRLLNVELDRPRLASLREAAPVLVEPSDHTGGEIGRLAGRLSREFHSGDTAASLAIEALALELLVETCRLNAARRDDAPAWLATAQAYLHAHSHGSISLAEVARAASVHPAHLARVFRRCHRCTVGDYVRRLRLEAARRNLESETMSLADIAQAAGFADQSHFTRLFVRANGVTPAAFRRARRQIHRNALRP